jgi:hypothetical protein
VQVKEECGVSQSRLLTVTTRFRTQITARKETD